MRRAGELTFAELRFAQESVVKVRANRGAERRLRSAVSLEVFMQPRRIVALLFTAVVLVLVAVGCGGGKSKSPGSTTTSEGHTTTSASTTTTEHNSTTTTESK